MACFHPLQAWQQTSGAIVFSELGSIARELRLSCGRCIGCRLARSRSWAIRCVHESQMHELSCFVTLTFDNSFDSVSLDYRYFQLFMKRVRKWNGPTRFFAVGEYGAVTKRPHFHALLFGCYFSDRKKIGKQLWRSATLDKLWPHGHAAFGDVTFQSAAYCARYCCEKVTGPLADEHYKRVDLHTGEIISVVPEMAHMSLKPGIGAPWFDKFWRDVYAARDGVVLDGKTLPPPRFYDMLLERSCPDIKSDKEYDRYVESEKFVWDTTPERLSVRELVAKARLKTLTKEL